MSQSKQLFLIGGSVPFIVPCTRQLYHTENLHPLEDAGELPCSGNPEKSHSVYVKQTNINTYITNSAAKHYFRMMSTKQNRISACDAVLSGRNSTILRQNNLLPTSWCPSQMTGSEVLRCVLSLEYKWNWNTCLSVVGSLFTWAECLSFCLCGNFGVNSDKVAWRSAV
jgi:hypothetical protein